MDNSWDFSDTDFFFQNMEIYIGNDSQDYTKNTKCEGGPFFDVEDDSNYSFDQNVGNLVLTKKVWNYGKEIWCNLEGRYTHILASQAHRPPG